MRAYKKLRRKWLMHKAEVHIVSFPKCGRTWLCLMLGKALEHHYGLQVKNPLKLRHFKKKVKDLPLIMQHHDGGPEFKRPEELERDKSFYSDRKVIFLVRDPRDVTVSAYYQKTKRNYNFQGSLKEYVYHPVGSIESNIEFYNIWADQSHVPKDFLLLTYEDMHADAEKELEKALRFVGLNEISSEDISYAVEECRFENMRRIEASNALQSKNLAPRNPQDEKTYKTREGVVGGHRKYLDSEDMEYIDRLIDKNLDDKYEFYKTQQKKGKEEI